MVDILFLETCVRSVTERKAVKSLKRLLIDSSDCFVLLNEQSSVTFSPPKHHQLMASKDDSVEDEETHRLRLMAESCSLLLSSFPSSYAAAFLVLHESHDPLALLCQQLSLPFTTLQSHLENLVAKKLLPESVLTELSQLMTTILPSNSSSSSSKGAAIYSPYLSESAIQKGLASSELFIGTLTIYPHTNREEGEVEVTNALDSRIFLISGKLPLNRALDGDEVVVRKLPPLSSSSCRKPSRLLEDIMNEEDDNNEVMVRNSSPSPAYLGLDYVEVVGIRRRMERDIMARIPFSAPKNFHPQSLMEEEEEGREEAVLVCPLDRRLPKIRVRTKQRAFLSSQRFLVTINSWSIDSQYPNGHISHILGPCNDWRVEVKCLLQENSLHPKPFSLQALACLPSIPSQSFSNASSDESKLMEGVPSGIAKKWVDSNFILSQELLRGRRDFRKDRVVFSVDPPGCQDVTLHSILPLLPFFISYFNDRISLYL